MNNEERMWWMTLVNAEAASARGTEECLLFSDVANHARKVLRDQFNINLDDVSSNSMTNFIGLVTDLREKNTAKEEYNKYLKDLIRMGEALLKKETNDKT